MSGTRGSSLVWGGLLVLAGVLFLLGNLGVLNGVDWSLVWPLALIAVGVWLILVRVGPGAAAAGVDSAEARGTLSRAKLELALGGARLQVRGADLGEQLYRVHVDHTSAAPEVGLDRQAGTLRIAQRADWLPGLRRIFVDAELSSALPWAVSCATGAISAEFDLAALQLTSFDCRTGGSRIGLKLGAPRGAVPVRVEGGALTVELTRPPGVAVLVKASGGAVHLSADGSAQHGIGTREWRSPGFDAAADRYEVVLAGAATTITVGTA